MDLDLISLEYFEFKVITIVNNNYTEIEHSTLRGLWQDRNSKSFTNFENMYITVKLQNQLLHEILIF